MGRKRSRKRKQVYLYFAGLIWLSACTSWLDFEERQTARSYLREAEGLLLRGDYDGSLRENQKVLTPAADNILAAEALFNMGVIYSHPENPNKDSAKAIAILKQLGREYPESIWAERGKIWAGVIENFEKSKKVDIEIEKKRRDSYR